MGYPHGFWVGSEVAGGFFSPWSDFERAFGDDVAVRRCRGGDNEELLGPVKEKARGADLLHEGASSTLAGPC